MVSRFPAAMVAVALTVTACSTGEEPFLVESGPSGARAIGGEETAAGRDDAPTIQIAPGNSVVAETTTTTEPPPPRPPLVIYDTDMGPDIDDVLALAMLHTYERAGEVEIAAVTVSRNSLPGARFSDVINTFYGRPSIPIGVYRGGTDRPKDDNNNFTKVAGNWEYDLPDDQILDGYKVQRKVLADAQAEGRDVIFIQTGFSGNLAALLDSGPDDISDRPGMDLVRDNVSLLSVMAGSPEGTMVEFNIENDLPSARKLFDRWPSPLVLSPFDVGYVVLYPYSSIASDFNWVDRHPVREAYEFRDLSWHQDAPPYYDMRSWDLMSVLYAVEPDADYFPLSEPGTISVDEQGRTIFQPGDGGQHRFMVGGRQYDEGQRSRITDRMIELASAQP